MLSVNLNADPIGNGGETTTVRVELAETRIGIDEADDRKIVDLSIPAEALQGVIEDDDDGFGDRVNIIIGWADLTRAVSVLELEHERRAAAAEATD